MVDRDALYTELFQLYHQSLKNFCIAKGVRPENIDDIVSEAFARALAHSDLLITLARQQQRAWLYSAIVLIIKENNTRRSPTVFSEIENIENYIKNNDELKHYQSEEDFNDYVQQVYDELSSEKERELFGMIFDRKIDYSILIQKFDFFCRILHIFL